MKTNDLIVVNELKDCCFCPKIRPCSISCNGDFMIDDEPCTFCDVYYKFKNKEENRND